MITRDNERKEAPVIKMSTISAGVTGALAMSACFDAAISGIPGSRERIGAGQVMTFVLRSPRVGYAAGWNTVDVPTPMLVRSGGAGG